MLNFPHSTVGLHFVLRDTCFVHGVTRFLCSKNPGKCPKNPPKKLVQKIHPKCVCVCDTKNFPQLFLFLFVVFYGGVTLTTTAKVLNTVAPARTRSRTWHRDVCGEREPNFASSEKGDWKKQKSASSSCRVQKYVCTQMVVTRIHPVTSCRVY